MVSKEHLQSLSVDYGAGSEESADDYPDLPAKLNKASEVIEEALRTYDNPAVLWTGGKDSTLLAYIVREVLDEYDDLEEPTMVFLDHGQHFDDVVEFVTRWSDNWDFDLEMASNEDEALYGTPGQDVHVDDLSERNQYEVREKLEFEKDVFPRLLDTLCGNHLLKTVALNDAIEEADFDGIITGVRWDEQESRGRETFFSPRHDSEKFPAHDRVHPILQFDERDVWDATWSVMVPESVEGFPADAGYPDSHHEDDLHGFSHTELPVSRRYYEGYRSLGSETSTNPSADNPAWSQDIEGTEERAGRAQDKEDLMDKLRDLGYM